jgi:hypothetical protein
VNDDLAGQIRRDLWACADLYDEVLEPVRRAAGSHVTATKEPPLPISAAILDARADTSRDLHYWARFILDEVRDVNGDLMTNRITDTRPETLVRFIVIWVDRLVSEFPDDADNLARETAEHVRELRQFARPERRDWMPIGECPVTVADAEGNSVPCGAKVRAYPDRAFIACPSCGTEDTLAWWMSQIVGNPDAKPLVTADELISIVARDLGMLLSHEQIRQWATRNKIPRSGSKDAKGRTLYDHAVVVALIRLGKAA